MDIASFFVFGILIFISACFIGGKRGALIFIKIALLLLIIGIGGLLILCGGSGPYSLGGATTIVIVVLIVIILLFFSIKIKGVNSPINEKELPTEKVKKSKSIQTNGEKEYNDFSNFKGL